MMNALNINLKSSERCNRMKDKIISLVEIT